MVNGGTHPSLDKRNSRRQERQMQKCKAEAVCLVMGVSIWEFASWNCGMVVYQLAVAKQAVVAKGCLPCQNHRKQHHNGGQRQGGDSWFIVQ